MGRWVFMPDSSKSCVKHALGLFPCFSNSICVRLGLGKEHVFTASRTMWIKMGTRGGLSPLFFLILHFQNLFLLPLIFSFSQQRTKNPFKKSYPFPQSPCLLTFRPQSKPFLLSQAFPIGKHSSFFFLWGILTAGLNLIIVFCTCSQKPRGHNFTFF